MAIPFQLWHTPGFKKLTIEYGYHGTINLLCDNWRLEQYHLAFSGSLYIELLDSIHYP